jgi:hypothetical protein
MTWGKRDGASADTAIDARGQELGYTEILVRHLTNDQLRALSSSELLAAVRAALA